MRNAGCGVRNPKCHVGNAECERLHGAESGCATLKAWWRWSEANRSDNVFPSKHSSSMVEESFDQVCRSSFAFMMSRPFAPESLANGGRAFTPLQLTTAYQARIFWKRYLLGRSSGVNAALLAPSSILTLWWVLRAFR